VPAQDRLKNHRGCITTEWHGTGRHLINHCAEGKQVCPVIESFLAPVRETCRPRSLAQSLDSLSAGH